MPQIYTPQEIAYVQKYYANHPTKHIALCLDIAESRVQQIAEKFEIKKLKPQLTN